MLAWVGFSLLAFYQANPAELPEAIAAKSDCIFPYYVATQLKWGLAGLVIAALYAATMSSVDSGINSVCTASMVDFYRRLKHGERYPGEVPADEARDRAQLYWARVLTFVYGAIATVLACSVGQLGTIIEIANKVINAFAGPMFALFVLGLFCRRARGLGVTVGAVLAVGATSYLTFGTRMTFTWPAVVGLVSTLVFGYLFSLVQGPPRPAELEWTFRRVMRRKGGP